MGRKKRETAVGGEKIVKVRRVRKDGWTEAKKREFLAELAATCNVTLALERVGMEKSSLYRLRRRSAKFRADWAEALRVSYAKLELELLDRAMNGTVKTIVRGDGRTETIREYPNGIALALLKIHKDKVAEAEVEHDPVQIEEVRQRIMRKLAIVKQRIEDGEA
jgi:hypothetical protein